MRYALIRARPIDYLRSINQAVYIYFHSASDFDLITGNRDTAFALSIYGGIAFFMDSGKATRLR